MIENTDKRHHREGNIRFGSSNWGSLRVFEKPPFKLWAHNIINSDYYQSNFLYSPRCFILQKNSRNCMTVQTLSTQLYHLLIENDSSENIVWLSSQVQASLWWPGRYFLEYNNMIYAWINFSCYGQNKTAWHSLQTISTQLYHLLALITLITWLPGRLFSCTTKWFMLELFFSCDG